MFSSLASGSPLLAARGRESGHSLRTTCRVSLSVSLLVTRGQKRENAASSAYGHRWDRAESARFPAPLWCRLHFRSSALGVVREALILCDLELALKLLDGLGSWTLEVIVKAAEVAEVLGRL